MRKYEGSNGVGGAVMPTPLRSGDQFSRTEFLRVWEEHPEIKFAELIGGVVYMPTPVARQHGVTDCHTSGWLWVYHAVTRPAPKRVPMRRR